MKVKKIADIFPIMSIDEEGLIITKNADLCFAFEVNYPEIFKISEGSYLTCFEALMAAIRNLGEGYLVHKQDFFYTEKYKADLSYNENKDFVLIQNELKFQDRPYLNHKAFIYVILPNGAPDKRNSLQSSLFKSVLVPKFLTRGEVFDEFFQKVKSFESAINSTKLFTIKKIGKAELIGSKASPGLLDYYFTLSFKDKTLYDITSDNGHFKVATQESCTFVINDLEQYPAELQPIVPYNEFSSKETKMPASYGLTFGLNLQTSHIYNQILYIPKQQDLRTQLTQETKRHFSFSTWSRENTFSMEQKTLFVDAITSGENVAVKAHFNIQVFAPNKKELDKKMAMTSSAIETTGFRSKVATVYGEQLYWSCIPGNASEIGSDNLATCLLDNAVAMFNMETNYKTSPFQKKGMLLTDRMGRARLFDPFFEPLKRNLIFNRNFCVIGPSGTGKSFMMNNMVYYLLEQGAHITIVDIGNSYLRLAEIKDAKYITHTSENPIRLNPFYMRFDDEANSSTEKVKLEEEFKEVIAKIIFVLFKKADDISTKAEEVTVGMMVTEYYNYLNQNQHIYPKFDTFYEFIRDVFQANFKKAGGRADKEFDIKNFLFITQIFYKGGSYDFLLNAEDETDYSKVPFLIYELDNIKDNTTLLPIITLVITNTYVTKLLGVKNTLKILFIEEAWKAVSNQFFAEFLLWAFKTVRKHLGSIGVVSQEIEDLLKSPVIKEAIVQNTEIKFILDINKYENQKEQVLELFKINESDLPQIFSINKAKREGRGAFKEVAIKLGRECTVYGIEVSKYAYALFTTEATEVDQIRNISKKKSISFKDAAFEWAETLPD